MATTDINTLIYAANDLFRQVPGIARVYNEAPDVPPSGDLPCIIPVSSSIEQQDKDNGSGLQRKDYSIDFLLLVTPYNKNLVVMEKQARPLADLALDLFWTHGMLGITDGSIIQAMLSAARYGQLTYNESADYLGWTFTLTVAVKQELVRGY